MSLTWRGGLRFRLAAALALVAAVAVGLATVIANRGLDSRLEASTGKRLHGAASHVARLGKRLYRRDRDWTPDTLTDLRHVGDASGYRIGVDGPHGRTLTPASSPQAGARATATAAVLLEGRLVGTVTVAPIPGDPLSDAEPELHDRLNGLHLLAGALAIAAALLAAPLVAGPLARPVRRLTEAARRMQRGDLGARVKPAGPAETRQLADAFNRLADTLERQEQARQEGAANAAHELRTPVAGLLARIEAAQDGVFANPSGNLGAMHAEALRLTRLVEDLETLADAERPELFLERSMLDLGSLVGVRVGMLEAWFVERGIELDRRLTPAPTYGDPARLAQVVDNLLTNALRYTKPGGRVTVAVGGGERTSQLEVSDTGVGIDEQDLPRVFERFWRGEPSRSRGSGGSGIGLAIVRQLVRAHGGEVTAESDVGRGTSFRVVLPAGRVHHADHAGVHRSFKSGS